MKSSPLYYLSIVFFLSLSPLAESKVVDRYLKNSGLVGETNFNYLWMNIYDISLYSEQGVYDPDGDLALEITYHRPFKGEKIAERSILEIKKQGFGVEEKLNRWLYDLTTLFPDVEKGDRIIGIRKNSESIFYLNEKPLGKIPDREFAERFFNIWLSKNSSNPDLTRELIGN